MSKRNKTTEHDKAVRKKANELKKEGWKVKADIPGFEKPSPVGRNELIPDIEATKAGAKRLYEIETPESMIPDKKQREVFRRHAKNKPRTTFHTIETSKSKTKRTTKKVSKKR